jgi:hypothetical protein
MPDAQRVGGAASVVRGAKTLLVSSLFGQVREA